MEELYSAGCKHVGICDPTSIHGGHMQETCRKAKGRCGGYFTHQRHGDQDGWSTHDFHSHLWAAQG